MGVPTSGALSLRNIARERLHGNYGGGGTIIGAVAMYDLLNGGQTGGSGNSYPLINGGVGNVSPNGSMESWYGYCQNWVGYYGPYSGYVYTRNFPPPCNTPGGTGWLGPYNYYANEECTDFSDPLNNGWNLNVTTLYDSNAQPCSGGTVSPWASKKIVVYFAGGGNPNVSVNTNSSGVITSVDICD
mgnify:FL=1